MNDFPIWTANISAKESESLGRCLDKMSEYEAAGHLIKAELEGIRFTFSRVLDEGWKNAVKNPYFYSGRIKERTREEQELDWSFSIPYPHVISGYLKRAQKATKAAGPYRDALIAFLTEVEPACARLVALKALVGKRPPSKTKVEIEREGVERTCQVCGRGIFANTGVIAHHGYQRPGEGWQTPSCNGARELPFEQSRAALGAEIVRLKNWEAMRVIALKNVVDETAKFYIKYQVSIQDPRRGQGFKIVEDRTLDDVTRENFEELKLTCPEAFAGKYGARKANYTYEPFTFDSLKASRVAGIENEIAQVRAAIREQEARYSAWTQTATVFNGAWVAKGQKVREPAGEVGEIAGFYEHFPAQPGDIAGGVIVSPVIGGFKSWNLAELAMVDA